VRKNADTFFVAFAFLASSTVTSSIARACLGEFSETSIFFDEQDLKAGIDGQAVAKVTITELSNEFSGVARVDKTIKGAIDTDKIVITLVGHDCARGFGVGAGGIVVGSLQRNARGELVLNPTAESNSARRARRKAHSLQ
jgi:hypothetical protein